MSEGTDPSDTPPPAPREGWLDADQELAWRAIGMLISRLHGALECQLERDAGLSFMEYYALARLSEEPCHTLRLSRLASVTNSSLSRLSHLVTRLESWGLVRREPDGSNRRYTNAVLTREGYAKLAASAPAHVSAVRELVVDELSPAELDQLRGFCDRIVTRVNSSQWKQDPV